MAQSESIFKKMDTAIFAKIDQLKQGPAYTQFVQTLGNLSEQQRRTLNLIVSFLFLFIPLTIFLSTGLKGIGLRKQINMKKEILEISNIILNNTAELENAGRNFFSSRPLTDKNDLISRLQAAAQTTGANLDSLKVENFSSKVDQFSLTQSKAEVSFKDFTISQLTALLSHLADRDKIRLGNMEIVKSSQNNMLSGTLQLIHSGRGGSP